MGRARAVTMLCVLVASCGDPDAVVSVDDAASTTNSSATSDAPPTTVSSSDAPAATTAAADASATTMAAHAPTGEPCDPGPSDSAGVDDTVQGRRGEALVKHLTGIDELVLEEEQEGVDIIYDDPNYGGVWGDRVGGWVVAVLDCSQVDADQIARLAGGPNSVRLIQVPHTFEEVNGFRDQLFAELIDSGVPGGIQIDSTLTGRHIIVVVEDPTRLGAEFGRAVPPEAFSIEAGPVPVEEDARRARPVSW